LKGSLDCEFKAQLKAFIITACDKDTDPSTLADDAPLFGPDSPLGLDSIDGLQLSVALERGFGVKITDSKEFRRVFTSVNALADYLRRD
jgi:acyl carrier protein